MEVKKSNSLIKDIEAAIDAVFASESENREDEIDAALEAIRIASNNNEQFIIPVELSPETAELFDQDKINVGDVIETDEELRFSLRTITRTDGVSVLAAFTSQEEVKKGNPTSTVTMGIEEALERGLMFMDVEGIVIKM